jgi:hypothetical protein
MPVPLATPPVNPASYTAVHAKVLTTPFDISNCGLKLKALLEQTIAVTALEEAGTGFTVTSQVIGVPLHPFAMGVMVYRTTPPALVVVNVCEMAFPLPPAWPAATPLNTLVVHVKVVPETLLGFCRRMFVVPPLHKAVVLTTLTDAVGTGFTVTSTFKGGPTQPPVLPVARII